MVSKLADDLAAAGISTEVVARAYSQGLQRVGKELSESALSREDSLLIDKLLAGRLEVTELPGVVRVLYFAGFQRQLAKHHMRFPAYNVLDEYFLNVSAPWGPVVLPRPRATPRWALFGRPINFPIGVPASVLTGNSRWIQYFANNGFNVLTYKTVRSRTFGANQAPNWAFVSDVVEPWEVVNKHRSIWADPADWVDPGNRAVTTTNSFGVPSPEPIEWMADVENALTVLAADQLLIVSVMGDDYESSPKRKNVIRDFSATAKLAETAGAYVVELNLSCPNSLDTSGKGVKPPICLDPSFTRDILEEARSCLDSSTRLVAKLSFLDEDILPIVIDEIAPLVDGIAGVNTLQCSVERPSGGPTFPNRELAGVSGIAIRRYAQDFVARLARARAESGHYFEILGMGGVTDPQSFEDLYALGASAVQTASGAFANPFLAAECVEALGDSLPVTPDIVDPKLREALSALVDDIRNAHPAITDAGLAAVLPLRADQAMRFLSMGAKEASRPARPKRRLRAV